MTTSLQVHDNCPRSLTSPSECEASQSYRDSCLAYCEQYIYWFYGPEVPFPDSNCGANETCTFAGPKGLSITNNYAFTGGMETKAPLGDLEAAFNLGATHTYSKTTSTMQTLTHSRPNASIEDCGYWTFLPYYVQCVVYNPTGAQY